jgi:chromate transporter
LRTVNVGSLILTVAAVLAVFRFKVGMIPTLAACAAVGMLWFLVTGGV